jgi:hypothetical protein
MRIFAFGCSMTQYVWPTWADIIAQELGYVYQNWGRAGIGNVGIFNRIVECNVRNKINCDDLVLVMWSSFFREDRHNGKNWVSVGNIHSGQRQSSRITYDAEFIAKHWSDRGATLLSCNAIVAGHQILQGSMAKTLLTRMHNHAYVVNNHETGRDILAVYEPIMNFSLPSLRCFLPGKWDKTHVWPDQDWHDTHPLPTAHLAYVEDVLAPHLKITISQKTRDWVANREQEVLRMSYDTARARRHDSQPETF